MRARRALAIAAGTAMALLLGCSATPKRSTDPVPRSAEASISSGAASTSGAPSTPVTSAAVTPTLPPGALVELVPAVGELPAGYAVVDTGSGPLDLAGAAELSSDPDAAKAALQHDGFRDAYDAQFAADARGDFLSVVVYRFRNEAGARATFAREKRESVVGTQPVRVAAVGDESFAIKEKLAEGDSGEIGSIRLRVGSLVWLVETSGQGAPDFALARAIAARLAHRIS